MRRKVREIGYTIVDVSWPPKVRSAQMVRKVKQPTEKELANLKPEKMVWITRFLVDQGKLEKKRFLNKHSQIEYYYTPVTK